MRDSAEDLAEELKHLPAVDLPLRLLDVILEVLARAVLHLDVQRDLEYDTLVDGGFLAVVGWF